MRYRKTPWIVFIILLLAGLLLAIFGSGSIKRQDKWEDSGRSVPVISTRGQYIGGDLVEGMDPYAYELLDGAGGHSPLDSLSGDVIVIIHGFNNTPEKASVKFRTAELSLRSAGFEGIVLGYSWDANTQKDPFGTTGYHEGRRHSVANGRNLAQFVADTARDHPAARLHLVGYSMGARLALETLVALDEDPTFSGRELQVASVHLVGAAVDNEEVELREHYGTAIEHSCGLLVNYYSPEDNALGLFFPLKEGDRALGEGDIEHPADAPANYRSINVESELVSYDSDLVPDDEYGDNHSGCLGNIGPDGQLLDDGIMDVVVQQLKAQPGSGDLGG